MPGWPRRLRKLPATTADPAYSGLLKRRPVQARSIARVDAILDAAAELIAGGGLEALTMRAVASRANVTPATIYQFFDDRETLIQALAVRYVAATPDVARRGPPPADESWRQALDRIIDAYAAMLRDAPAMRALWLAGVVDAATGRIAAGADDEIAAGLRARLTGIAGTDRGTGPEWRYLVTLAGDLLRRAFQHDPTGDPFLLERAKRVASLYAADLLDGEMIRG